MSPSLPDILIGQSVALSTVLPEEAAGAYLAGRMGILSMLSMLAAQEAERGFAAALWENETLRALLAEAAPRYRKISMGAAPPDLGEGDWGSNDAPSLGALTATNAALRRRLIALHEAVEAAGDAALDRRILEIYAKMAAARRLELAVGG